MGPADVVDHGRVLQMRALVQIRHSGFAQGRDLDALLAREDDGEALQPGLRPRRLHALPNGPRPGRPRRRRRVAGPAVLRAGPSRGRRECRGRVRYDRVPLVHLVHVAHSIGLRMAILHDVHDLFLVSVAPDGLALVAAAPCAPCLCPARAPRRGTIASFARPVPLGVQAVRGELADWHGAAPQECQAQVRQAQNVREHLLVEGRTA
mmetsp:Transcript_50506/g.153646  ORF Transcript_50506/g.153646 Transcript_50506/m.153646 type:complete len:207 (+) Transcript_50506:741-1361(+)